MKALIERLNKIQREMKAVKGRSDPSGRFTYRSADDIMSAVKPFLGTSTVILCTDGIYTSGETQYIVSEVALTDGTDSIKTTGYAEIPDAIMSMSKPQIIGACSSYARKYALQGLLALDDNPEIDSAAQYAEEYEEFVDCLKNEKVIELAYLTANMEPEAHGAVWNMLKREYIPKGEIGVYRERIRQLKEQADEKIDELLAMKNGDYDAYESAVADLHSNIIQWMEEQE